MLVDSFMLAAVAHELNRNAKGWWVRSVKAVAPFTIALPLQGRGKGRIWLLASAHTRYAHIGWQREAPASLAEPHEETERFADVLERHLEQARFLEAEQVDFDRLLVLRFVTLTPLGERKRYALWCEIMGKHSNLVLVDEGVGIIVDALKRLPLSLNRYREVLPNKPYIRPPTGDRRNPLTITESELEHLAASRPVKTPSDWAKVLFGMSDPLLALLQERFGDLTKAETMAKALAWLLEIVAKGEFAPTIWCDQTGMPLWCYPLPAPFNIQLQASAAKPQPPVSTPFPTPTEHFGSNLTKWLQVLMTCEGVEQRRQSLLATIQRNLAGIERQLQELNQRWQEAKEAERYRHWGELLLTFAHQIPEGATEAEVTDFDAEPPQTMHIPLPEGKSAVEAAQHYFALYRKLKSAAETVPSVLERLRLRREEWIALAERVKKAGEAELTELAAQIRKTAQLTPSPTGKRDGDFLRFVVAGDYEVWVGRHSEANLRLLRSARPDDIWFHVKGATGSHALLRVKKRGEEVPQKAIEQAAQIAAYFSKRRTSSLVEVDYTRARYVRPVKGQKGLALYTHFKTIAVTPQLPEDSEPTPPISLAGGRRWKPP